jgi:hypothetical protein
MKAVSIDKYPKFLKCNDIIKKCSWNKYLPHPWVSGELVKVASEDEQHSHPCVGSSDEFFRRRYIVVYRKDDNGKFTIKQTAEWRQFDLLTNNKVTK